MPEPSSAPMRGAFDSVISSPASSMAIIEAPTP